MKNKKLLMLVFPIILMPIIIGFAEFGTDIHYGTPNGNDFVTHYFNGYDSTGDRSTHMVSYWDLSIFYPSGGQEDGCVPNDVAYSQHITNWFKPEVDNQYKLRFKIDSYGKMWDYNTQSGVTFSAWVEYLSGYWVYEKSGTRITESHTEFNILDIDTTYTGSFTQYYDDTWYRIVLRFDLSIGNSHCNPEAKIDFMRYSPWWEPNWEIKLEYGRWLA